MKPCVKWIGGKSKLAKHIIPLMKEHLNGINTYIEPFIGGGAIAIELNYKYTVINDMNKELINMYEVIRDNVDELIIELTKLAKFHSSEQYYEVRAWDQDPFFTTNKMPVERATRTIYLNKTCFNGLYRVNKNGYFNSPLGKTSSGKLPNILDESNLRELSDWLRDVTICCGDYKLATCLARPSDVVYLDPPYDYEQEDGFTSYQKDGWTRKDTLRLYEECERLRKLGCKVIISNNDTSYIRDLFKDWNIMEIDTLRSVNCKGNNRKSGKEVIIYC